MIQLYTLATSPATLSFDKSQIQLTGGSSDGYLELFPRFHRARHRQHPAVLAHLRALSRQRLGIYRRRMAGDILQLAAERARFGQSPASRRARERSYRGRRLRLFLHATLEPGIRLLLEIFRQRRERR